jgi:hypothetical protein
VNVRLPAGVLVVVIEDGRAVLTGPADEICSGEVSEEFLAEFRRGRI